MSKDSKRGEVNLAVPSVVVVVISLVMALAASIERPQQNQPSLEAFARAEGAQKRSAMP